MKHTLIVYPLRLMPYSLRLMPYIFGLMPEDMIHHFFDMRAEEKITSENGKGVKGKRKQHIQAYFPFVLDQSHSQNVPTGTCNRIGVRKAMPARP